MNNEIWKLWHMTKYLHWLDAEPNRNVDLNRSKSSELIENMEFHHKKEKIVWNWPTDLLFEEMSTKNISIWCVFHRVNAIAEVLDHDTYSTSLFDVSTVQCFECLHSHVFD